MNNKRKLFLYTLIAALLIAGATACGSDAPAKKSSPQAISATPTPVAAPADAQAVAQPDTAPPANNNTGSASVTNSNNNSNTNRWNGAKPSKAPMYDTP